MAESIIQVTSAGATKLHTFNRTIGANSVEDEVVLFGENYLASYVVADAEPSIATGNAHCLQIMAGASLKVRIRRIEIQPAGLATAAARGAWGIYRLTTAGTGGTAMTPALLDPADSASGATAMTLPTVKGTEGVIVGILTDAVTQTVPTSGVISPRVAVDFDRPRSKPLIIAAGVANGIAIKNLVAVAAASITINVWFDESNF